MSNIVKKNKDLIPLSMQEHLMLEYAAQFKSPAVDGKHLLSKLNALPDTPESFLKLDGILGRQRRSFSWEELREDAYSDKYGI